MLRLLVGVLLAVLLPVGTAFAVSSGYTQSWDDPSAGTAGWTGVIAASTTSRADGQGNPGGYLRTTLDNAAGVRDVGARALRFVPELVGDYSGAEWTLNFDIMLEEGSLDAGVLRLRGVPTGGGWVVDLAALPSVGSGWMSTSVTFSGGWTEAEARGNGWLPDNEHQGLAPNANDSLSWAETVANVRALSVRLSGTSAALTSGFDNFAIDSEPLVQTPEPSAALLISMGLGLLARRRSRH